MSKKVKCPKCGRETEYSPENKFRPFCSQRCQILDLGDWADESYRIPTNTAHDFTHNEDSEDLEKTKEND